MDGKRHIITIAAIGPDSGQTLTLGVYDALRQADALLLQAGDAQLLCADVRQAAPWARP